MSRIEELIKEKCPNGVKKYTIAELCKSLKKSTLKMSELLGDGYPVINSGRSLYGFYSDYNNEGPAFTVAARGEYAAFVNYFAGRFWAGGLCYPYTSKDETFALTKFIYYSLKNVEREIRNKIVADGSIPALNKHDLEKIKIPIPPIEVQEEIVRILDKFSELEAELEAELEVRKKQYEFWRNKLIENSSFNIKKLEDVTKRISDGSHNPPKGENYDTGYPMISAKNITNGIIELSNVRYLSHKDFEKEDRRTQGRMGDILLSIVGSIGKVAIIKECVPLLFQRSICVIKPDNDIINYKFLRHVLESDKYQKKLVLNSNGAAQKGIYLNQIKKLEIPLPSLEEQEKIANILDKFEKLVNDISEGIPAEIEARRKQYEYYRNKLLSFKELNTK